MTTATLITSDRIFRASDLNRRGREVLDAARATGARIADTDGAAMVMVAEGAVERVLTRLGVAELQVVAMRAWRELDAGRDVTADALRWANRLDADDRKELADDLIAAFDEAGRTGDARPLMLLLAEWRVTAEQPYDVGLLDRLGDGFRPEDYREVGRPAPDDA